jgi:hypothetical protein
MKKLKNYPEKVFAEHNKSVNEAFEGFKYKHEKHEDRD